MDYLKILRASKKIKNNERKTFLEIQNLIKSGSTGGEIISSVGGYLYILKVNDFEIYSIIYQEAEEFLKTCEDNGYDFNIFE